MNRKLRLPLALALALGSGNALALGLGQVEVRSSLYEPLEAEIPVLSSTPGEAEALTVRLASPEAFARVGLERPQLLAANLEFSVVENARGQKVVRITTKNKVNDPFLSFLVEADWGKGRLLREFTVLLDPPTSAPVARAATTAPARQPTPARPQPAPAPVAAAQQPLPQASAPESAPAPTSPTAPTTASAGAAASGGDYAVAAGDTLWSIANRTRPDGSVSVNQMMIALLQSNPDAFIDANINRIKRGAILRIPDRATLDALTAAQANAMVREQMDAWRSAQAPQLQPAEPEPRAAASAPTPVRTPGSRLELVPPRGDQPADGAQSGVDAQSGSGSELRAELARTREDLGTRDQEIRELRSQVEDLEGMRDDSQRLIAMKDSELATLQRRLAELEAERAAQADATAAQDQAPAAPAPGETEVPATGESPVSATDTADGGQDADADGAADADAGADGGAELLPPVTDDTSADAAATETGTQTTSAVPAEPVTTAASDPEAARPEPLPASQPWYRNLWLLGGLGLIVAGLLAFLLGRRRTLASEPVEPRGYDSDGLAASMAADRAAAPPLAGGDESQESEREAELLDALAERPEDLGRHLELARYYYELGDADAFEGAAEAMYAQIYDPDNLMWKQVVAMGRELLPDHPLFAIAAGDELLDEHAGTDTDGATEEMGADLSEQAQTPPWETAQHPLPGTGTAAKESPGVGPEPSLQQDWDADTGATGQFSFDELDTAARGSTAEPGFTEDSEFESGGFDSATPVPEAELPSHASPPGSPAADEEAPAANARFEYGGDDAASTKLELARAYLDMGDVEGARGMLEEVMGEGNAGQRAEARRLLDEIR